MRRRDRWLWFGPDIQRVILSGLEKDMSDYSVQKKVDSFYENLYLSSPTAPGKSPIYNHARAQSAAPFSIPSLELLAVLTRHSTIWHIKLNHPLGTEAPMENVLKAVAIKIYVPVFQNRGVPGFTSFIIILVMLDRFVFLGFLLCVLCLKTHSIMLLP